MYIIGFLLVEKAFGVFLPLQDDLTFLQFSKCVIIFCTPPSLFAMEILIDLKMWKIESATMHVLGCMNVSPSMIPFYDADYFSNDIRGLLS